MRLPELQDDDKEAKKLRSKRLPEGLADLLANKKAVAPLLRFLKATNIRRKKGARE